jgi:hypothetical protein
MDEALWGMQICTLLTYLFYLLNICFRKEFFKEEKKIGFVFAAQSSIKNSLSIRNSNEKRTKSNQNATSKRLF